MLRLYTCALYLLDLNLMKFKLKHDVLDCILFLDFDVCDHISFFLETANLYKTETPNKQEAKSMGQNNST